MEEAATCSLLHSLSYSLLQSIDAAPLSGGKHHSEMRGELRLPSEP